MLVLLATPAHDQLLTAGFFLLLLTLLSLATGCRHLLIRMHGCCQRCASGETEDDSGAVPMQAMEGADGGDFEGAFSAKMRSSKKKAGGKKAGSGRCVACAACCGCLPCCRPDAAAGGARSAERGLLGGDDDEDGGEESKGGIDVRSDPMRAALFNRAPAAAPRKRVYCLSCRRCFSRIFGACCARCCVALCGKRAHPVDDKTLADRVKTRY